MRRDRQAGAEFRGFVRDVAAFAGGTLWRVMALAVAASAAEGIGLMLLVPFLGVLGIDGSSRWESAPVGLGLALFLYVLLVGAAALLVSARSVAMATLRLAYADDLRRRIHSALLAMEWRAFNRLRGSDATNVLTQEIQRAAHGVEFLLRSLAWILEILALLVVAFHLSAPLTAICLVLAAVCVVLGRPLNHRVHALGGQLGEMLRAAMADISDDLAGMRLIRGLGLENGRRQRLGRRFADVRGGQLELVRAMAHHRAALQAAAAAAAALAIWVSVRVLGVALADTLVLMAAFARLVGAALRIQDGWRTVLNALPAHAAAKGFLDRCRAVADAPAEAAAIDAPMLTEGIELDGIGFSYGSGRSAALSNIRARIAAGTITAIAGQSGAGKSTLADLLSGLTEATDGVMRVDGVVLTGGLRQAWRRRVGYVAQDCFLFHDTIRANLLLAAPAADEVAIWAALDAAAAADFVRALPDGLDSVAGDRGCQLSGGQRQRLTLARALLADFRLLILDEATGALDSDNEARVLDALARLRGRLTIIIIAHRQSTLRLADQVLVLEGGQLVAGQDMPVRLPIG